MLGTKLCDGCWEVEHRLVGYLQRGRGNALRFIRKTVENYKP